MSKPETMLGDAQSRMSDIYDRLGAADDCRRRLEPVRYRCWICGPSVRKKAVVI